jgi:hypothetical protein
MPNMPRLKNGLINLLNGTGQNGSGLVGMPDRTFERGQGCWNCIHAKKAVDFWTTRRKEYLNKAMQITLNSPQGEKHPTVVQYRRVIDIYDHGVGTGAMVRCDVGRTANGNPVGDLVANAFLCDRWTGRDGASLARIDGKLDVLPEELRERIDGSDPITPEMLAEKTVIELDDGSLS